MIGIPPALNSDTEDVAWALQTADALWKRNERVDAIVWLRRAAQSAAEADDDDRALTLARNAAELSEWIARNAVAGGLPSRTATEVGQPLEEVVDELLASADDEPDDSTHPEIVFADGSAPISRTEVAYSADGAVPPPPSSVPTGAELHSGMYDPWAKAETTDSEYETVEADVLEAEDLEDEDERDLVTSAPRIPVAQPVEIPDLSEIEAFSDLPDDLRDTLAGAAHVLTLERGDEVSGFALALVLEGAVEVSATVVDAPVARLEEGGVLRSRGTVENVTPVRLVAAGDRVRVATWEEAAVTEVFASCPWVEDELRAAADQTHALVGVTKGALGERIDPTMRAVIAPRLALRVLSGNEGLLEAGRPIAGLHIVGAGELQVIGADGAPSTILRAGEVVFPAEVLRAASAPRAVRAGTGGALVLSCGRGATQELLVTCPPLLELLAESS